MAYSHFNYKSKVLGRDISLEISLPCYESAYKGNDEKFKTVYFLHGTGGSGHNYMTRFPIRECATANGLAVVAVSGENLAYLDCESVETYFSTWIGTELLDVTRRVFPLSDRREDTYIIGFSLGGYGAMVNGLRFPDRFGKIGALAGGFLDFDPALESPTGARHLLRKLMGSGEAYKTSYANVSYAIEQACANHVDIPKIYMACGTADHLFKCNEGLDQFLTDHGILHDYVRYPGEAHTANYICKVIPDIMKLLAEE